MGKKRHNKKYKKDVINLLKDMFLPIITSVISAIIAALINHWIDSEKEPKQIFNYQIIIINNQIDLVE